MFIVLLLLHHIDWGLRDYGVEGQLGLEKTPEEYVAKMVEIFREVRRVLRKDGTLWLNLGDSYVSQPAGNKTPSGFQQKSNASKSGALVQHRTSNSYGYNKDFEGLKPKDLCGIPWRVAFALQADGWYLRSDIIWAKPNPMPESVRDRPTKAHEYLFLLTKSKSYYYDQDAIREEYTEPINRWGGDKLKQETAKHSKYLEMQNISESSALRAGRPMRPNGAGRNKRTVWTIATQPYPEAHFATFPTKLVEPCILAGTSEKGCCPECGTPWVRVVEKKPSTMNIRVRDAKKGILDKKSGGIATESEIRDYGKEEMGQSETIGWKPQCDCNANPIPCIVLDPFIGSGTVAAVAKKHNRNWIGIELNQEYIELAEKRINHTQPRLL